MNVFLKQGNIEVSVVQPGSKVSVLANNISLSQKVHFYIFDTEWTYWDSEADVNWRNEAWIDNVTVPDIEGDFTLRAQAGSNYVDMLFSISSYAPTPIENMTLWKSYVDPLNYSYKGQAQTAVFTFYIDAPDQIPAVTDFFANRYIDECKTAVSSQSPVDHLLIINVYRDTSPTFHTNFAIEITSTDRTGDPLPWALIILVALALILTWLAVLPVLQSVHDILYGDGDGGGGVALVSYIPWIVGAIVVLVGANVIKGFRSQGVKK